DAPAIAATAAGAGAGAGARPQAPRAAHPGPGARGAGPRGRVRDPSPPPPPAGVPRRTPGKGVLPTSFGLEDQVILHWLATEGLNVDVVTLDTGRLFAETYDLWAATERRYGLRIRAIHPQTAELEALVAKQGINGFYDSREARLNCCHVRKVEPLNRALAGATGWIAALRADPSSHPHGLALRRAAATSGRWIRPASGATCSSSARCSTGRASRCSPARPPTTCRSTRCTPRASSRSGARRARGRSLPASRSAPDAGGGSRKTRRNAGCTSLRRSQASSIGRAQPIADSGLGEDVVRPLGIGLDLLPQLPHVDPQILRVGEIVPQRAEQEPVGEHLAGVLHQHAQEIVLLGRELHLAVAHLDDAPHQVDRKVAGPEDRALAVRLQLVAQGGAHAGEQLVHAERL